MSFILSRREDHTRYKVRVVGTDDKKINSLTAPVSKGKRVVRNVMQKAVSALMLAMFTSLAFLGALVSASPAQADFIQDGFKGAFCSAGLFNYELSAKQMGPNTGDHKITDTTITPYEKYGTVGLNYTVWLGPERAEGLKDKGEFGGVTIVNYAGGSGATKINEWGKDVAGAPKDEASKVFAGFYNTTQTCVPVVDWISTGVANTLLDTTGEVITITNLVYQTAYEASSNIIVWLQPVIVAVVGTLKRAVFFEFLTPVIVVSALWMAWVGLVKRQSTQMAQGAIWMIASSVAAVALMTNPMWLPQTVNKGVSSISEAGMNAVASATVATSADNMCIGGTAGANPTSIDEKDGNKFITPENATTRKNVRQMQCTMWYSFLYTPWVMGEFGADPSNASRDSQIYYRWDESVAGERLGEVGQGSVEQLGSGVDSDGYDTKGYRDNGKVTPVKFGTYQPSGGAQNWALFMQDNQVIYDGSTPTHQQQQRLALLNVTAAQLHKHDYNHTFKGDSSQTRILTAGLALIAALGAALMVVIVSMSIIVLDVGMVILVLISPLFFLIGVHPGMGRRVALGWVETVLGLAIKRVVLSMILSIMLIFYSSILSQSSKMPWLVAMILVVAVSIGGISYKDQILSMFSKISLGGDGGLGSPDVPGSRQMKRHLKRGAKKALGMSTGEFDAKEMASLINNRGAGSRPNESSDNRPAEGNERDKAAEQVHARNSGAGEAPKDGAGPAVDGGDGNPEDPKATAGAGAAPAELPEGEGATNEQDNTETDGAGDRPQHYLDAQGNVVDADGNVIEDSELSDEERAALGGAGERPLENDRADRSASSQAAENLRNSNPAVIAAKEKAAADREANKNRLLPPLPVTQTVQDEAAKYNKALDKEHKKLSKNSDTPVSRAAAMESLSNKTDAAEQARRQREERKQYIAQKSREVLAEPARELAQMASSADASFGNPVKKSVEKAGNLTQRAGNAVNSKMETSWEQRNARKEFEKQVDAQVVENRKVLKQELKERRERQKSVPKEYRHVVK